MAFNENTRVKIPAILHLCRLGYTYKSLRNATRDESTNIFTDIFEESILRINPGAKYDEVKRLFEDVSLTLDNEDLGKAFYEILEKQLPPGSKGCEAIAHPVAPDVTS